MRSTASFGWLASLLLIGSACEENPTRLPVGVSDVPGEVSGSDDVDALMALGYAGHTEEDVEPDRDSVRRHDRERCWPGYNLTSSGRLAQATLFDMNGAVVHRWQRAEEDSDWMHVELLEGGELLVVARRRSDTDPRGFDNVLRRLDGSGRQLWVSDVPAHHDASLAPDGTIATLTFRYRDEPGFEHELKDNGLALVSGAGELLEEHSLTDLLGTRPDLLDVRKVAPTQKFDRTYIDLVHANSVEIFDGSLEHLSPLFRRGNALVSVRHQHVVVILDLEAGELVWAWGRGEISGPHHATLLDSGNILLFDNGVERRWSRVLEVDPVSGRIAWEYSAPKPASFFSLTRGSNERLPNGNTLIGNSDSGEAFEVTSSGDVVWRWLNPEASEDGKRATIDRMRRYDPEWIEAWLAPK